MYILITTAEDGFSDYHGPFDSYEIAFDYAVTYGFANYEIERLVSRKEA
jgi:hypothetical protein